MVFKLLSLHKRDSPFVQFLYEVLPVPSLVISNSDDSPMQLYHILPTFAVRKSNNDYSPTYYQCIKYYYHGKMDLQSVWLYTLWR